MQYTFTSHAIVDSTAAMQIDLGMMCGDYMAPIEFVRVALGHQCVIPMCIPVNNTV